MIKDKDRVNGLGEMNIKLELDGTRDSGSF